MSQARAAFGAARVGLVLACALSSVREGRAATAVDRVVVRFDAPETGGIARPKFVFERELAFEARLEARLEADADRGENAAPYLDRHVRGALERHIAEELLSHLTVDPEPTAVEIKRRAEQARDVLEQRVGGEEALERARLAEGIDPSELDAIVDREARASLYLDRMVAPMFEPSEAELREVHHAATNPFRGQRFDDVAQPLRRWYVGQRLDAALGVFYQNARGRIHVVVLGGSGPRGPERS